MTQLIELMKDFGGKISTRALNDHKDNPYEINISLWDAMRGTIHRREGYLQLERFICAHAIMLGLKGIPAIYIHSLLGTSNDYERRENLQSTTGPSTAISGTIRHCVKSSMILTITTTRYFLPFADLWTNANSNRPFTRMPGRKPLTSTEKLWRSSADRMKLTTPLALLCIHNITDQAVTIPPKDLPGPWRRPGVDLISETPVQLDAGLTLTPYQSMWIKRVQPQQS